MHRQVISAVLALTLVVTGVTYGVGVGAADHNRSESVLEGVLTDAPESTNSSSSGLSFDTLAKGWAGFTAGVGGADDRAGWWISQQLPEFLSGDETTAADQARAASSYYAANNETLESYVNERGNVSSDRTVKISWYLDGETATRYLLVNASDGNVTTSRIVTSTDRTADETLKLCNFAAASSVEELREFTNEYAEPGKDVDTAYLSRLKGRYGSDVETTLYPSSGDCSGGDS